MKGRQLLFRHSSCGTRPHQASRGLLSSCLEAKVSESQMEQTTLGHKPFSSDPRLKAVHAGHAEPLAQRIELTPGAAPSASGGEVIHHFLRIQRRGSERQLPGEPKSCHMSRASETGSSKAHASPSREPAQVLQQSQVPVPAMPLAAIKPLMEGGAHLTCGHQPEAWQADLGASTWSLLQECRPSRAGARPDGYPMAPGLPRSHRS